MFSLIFGFFSDLLYWIAIAAIVGGAGMYVLSYITKILPMLAGYALILQVVGVLLTLSGGYYVSDHHGYQRRVDEDQAEIDRLNTEARAKEAELNTKLARATSQLKQAKNDIKTKQASIDARIDSGELRLPSTCGVQTDTSTASIGGDKANAADTDRQAIKDIVAIAADGDTAITSLNACIVQYNQVMQTVNEGVK